ncbi:MAG: PIN domain-containing protein [Acidobacteriia bacterium]|nr:PIN domain-containing protein [Terriglobia bacterium]
MSGKGKSVLDASAVLALIQDEPGAARLWAAVPEGAVSAVNPAEVLAKLISRGMPRQEALAAFDALHLEVAAFDRAQAAISASYPGKGISLGDRCFLAAAPLRGVGWTSDRALAPVASVQSTRLEFFR